MIKSVVIKYYDSFHIEADYSYDKKLYCPSCGTNNVWIDQEQGDEYEGTNNICVSCETSFILHGVEKVDDVYKDVIQQIKSV